MFAAEIRQYKQNALGVHFHGGAGAVAVQTSNDEAI